MKERVVMQHLYYVLFSYPQEESIVDACAPGYVFYADDDKDAESLAVAMSYEDIKVLIGLYRVDATHLLMPIIVSTPMSTDPKRLSVGKKKKIGLHLVGHKQLLPIVDSKT